MKKLALAIIVLVVLGTVGCYAQKTKGNGNIITKEIQIADYSGLIVGQGIEINGSFFSGKNKSPQVNYTQQNGKSGLKITIDENLLPLLKFKIESGILKIETEKGTKIIPSRLTIEAHSTELKKLGVSSSIDFILKSSLSGDNIEINASGASDVYLEKPMRIANLCKINLSGASDLKTSDLECHRIEARSSGSSDLYLNGKANEGKFNCSGSSDIKGYGFTLKTLVCSASGSSDIFITVTESLNASASGSSDIKYKGNPKVKKHSSGSSDIDPAN